MELWIYDTLEVMVFAAKMWNRTWRSAVHSGDYVTGIVYLHWLFLNYENCSFNHVTFELTNPGADPGFPVGGGADPPGGEAPTYDFFKISQKLHEIKKILAPLGSATAISLCNIMSFQKEVLTLWNFLVLFNLYNCEIVNVNKQSKFL